MHELSLLVTELPIGKGSRIDIHYFLPFHAPILSTSYLTLTIPSLRVVADLVLLREEPAHLCYFGGIDLFHPHPFLHP